MLESLAASARDLGHRHEVEPSSQAPDRKLARNTKGSHLCMSSHFRGSEGLVAVPEEQQLFDFGHGGATRNQQSKGSPLP